MKYIVIPGCKNLHAAREEPCYSLTLVICMRHTPKHDKFIISGCKNLHAVREEPCYSLSLVICMRHTPKYDKLIILGCKNLHAVREEPCYSLTLVICVRHTPKHDKLIISGCSADGSALGSGPRGRGFKSRHSDHKRIQCFCIGFFCYCNCVMNPRPLKYGDPEKSIRLFGERRSSGVSESTREKINKACARAIRSLRRRGSNPATPTRQSTCISKCSAN